MSEFAGIITEATMIGSAAGGLVGYGAELLASKGIGGNRTAVVPGHEGIDPAHVDPHRFLRSAKGVLPMLGVVAGFAYAEALEPTPATPVTRPVVEVVVGHTQNSLESGGNMSLNLVAGGVIKSSRINPQLSLEHNNYTNLDPATIKQVYNDASLGDSKMNVVIPQAIDSAYANSTLGQSNIPGDANRHNAAVAIITQGETPGTAAQVSADVTLANAKGGEPVYVADSGSNPSLKRLATETHGKYYRVTKQNAAQVGEELISDITPPEIKQPHDNSQNGYLPLAVVVTGIAGIYANRRRKQTSYKEGNED